MVSPDFLLQRLDLPWFHALFQLMIFLALLESGCGIVHAINERVASSFAARGRTLATPARLGVASFLLVGSIFLADRYGMVALIASGYRGLALLFLVVYVLPLATLGLWRLVRSNPARSKPVRSKPVRSKPAQSKPSANS